MNTFLAASRSKRRFNSEVVFPGVSKSSLTTEQLWDIPLDAKSRVSINSLYIETETRLKESQVSGLVSKPTKGNGVLQLKLDVLKEIFTIRTAEQAVALEQSAHDKEYQQIVDAIAASDEKKFEGKTPEELQVLLAEAKSNREK